MPSGVDSSAPDDIHELDLVDTRVTQCVPRLPLLLPSTHCRSYLWSLASVIRWSGMYTRRRSLSPATIFHDFTHQCCQSPWSQIHGASSLATFLLVYNIWRLCPVSVFMHSLLVQYWRRHRSPSVWTYIVRYRTQLDVFIRLHRYGTGFYWQ